MSRYHCASECLCWEVSQHLDFNQKDPDLTNLEGLLHLLMAAAIKICSNINLLNKKCATVSRCHSLQCRHHHEQLWTDPEGDWGVWFIPETTSGCAVHPKHFCSL